MINQIKYFKVNQLFTKILFVLIAILDLFWFDYLIHWVIENSDYFDYYLNFSGKATLFSSYNFTIPITWIIYFFQLSNLFISTPTEVN